MLNKGLGHGEKKSQKQEWTLKKDVRETIIEQESGIEKVE